MTLSDFMATQNIRPAEMAALIGDVSASGVIKWARGERIPRPDQQRRIFDATDGKVTPNDFVLAPPKQEMAS